MRRSTLSPKGLLEPLQSGSSSLSKLSQKKKRNLVQVVCLLAFALVLVYIQTSGLRAALLNTEDTDNEEDQKVSSKLLSEEVKSLSEVLRATEEDEGFGTEDMADDEAVNEDEAVDSEESGEKAESITIAHLGDLMISQLINKYVYARGEFTHMWEGVRHLWEKADMAVANFEGTCAQLSASTPRRAVSNITEENFYSVYSSANSKGGFNYPISFAKAIYNDAKIRTVTLGNNHIFDRGSRGVTETKRNLESIGFTTFGVIDPEDLDKSEKVVDPALKYSVVYKKGWKLILISCSNFKVSPKWTPLQVNCQDVSSLVKGPIREDHPDNDAIIVFPHWGAEFKTDKAPQQVKLARQWRRDGVNVILGNHVHMPQSAESVRIQGKQGLMSSFTAFSLGGLTGGLGQLSKAQYRIRASAVLVLTLTKFKEKTVISDAAYTPICEVFEANKRDRANVHSIPALEGSGCTNERQLIKKLLSPAARMVNDTSKLV